jgi:putative hydrolase of the HAD superfamily
MTPRRPSTPHRLVGRRLSGELTITQQRRMRITTLTTEHGLGTWDTARADAWFTGYLAHYQAAWCAYPDVRPALDRLLLLKGVLTNGLCAIRDDDVHRVRAAFHYVRTNETVEPASLLDAVGLRELIAG